MSKLELRTRYLQIENQLSDSNRYEKNQFPQNHPKKITRSVTKKAPENSKKQESPPKHTDKTEPNKLPNEN